MDSRNRRLVGTDVADEDAVGDDRRPRAVQEKRAGFAGLVVANHALGKSHAGIIRVERATPVCAAPDFGAFGVVLGDQAVLEGIARAADLDAATTRVRER